MDSIRAIFLKLEHFFFIFKEGQEKPPPPSSCMSVSVNEYASIFLNVPKYHFKCLNNVLTMPGL